MWWPSHFCDVCYHLCWKLNKSSWPLPSVSVSCWRSPTESSWAPPVFTLVSHPIIACLADCENVSISLLASNISAFKIFLHWVAYLKIFQSLAVFIHSVQKSQTALSWPPNKVNHHRLSYSLCTHQRGSFFISQPPFPGFSNLVFSFTTFLLSEITQALSLLTKVLIFWGPLKVCILYDASFPSPEILLLIPCLILHFSPYSWWLFVID